MEKINISTTSLVDLISLEKIASITCKNYENLIKMYDGSINTNIKEYKIYTEFNNIRLFILNEMEKRLKNINYND